MPAPWLVSWLEQSRGETEGGCNSCTHHPPCCSTRGGRAGRWCVVSGGGGVLWWCVCEGDRQTIAETRVCSKLPGRYARVGVERARKSGLPDLAVF